MRHYFLCISAWLFVFALYAQPYDDSLSVDRQLVKISQGEYMNGILAETNRKQHNPIDPFAALGLTVDKHCDEICESYLVEINSKKKMLLPCAFDQGVQNLLFSPAKKHLAVYSSYDGPDYTHHYFYRAELLLYEVLNDSGLDAIAEPIHFHFYQWSIGDMVWLDPHTLALKLYSGPKNKTGGFQYFKLKI